MNKKLYILTSVRTGATRVTETIAKLEKNQFVQDFLTLDLSLDKTRQKLVLCNKLVEFKPDIVFCSFVCICAVVTEAVLEFNSSIKLILRSDYKLCDMRVFEKQDFIYSSNKAVSVILQTDEMMEEFSREIPSISNKLILLDNPIDKDLINTLANEGGNPFPNNGNKHIIWVGRKDPIKDLDTLQKAFDIVHANLPSTDLTLLSDDPNPFRWIKNTDCLVMSSKSEANPNVLREAYYLGCPIVSTKCSSIINNYVDKDFIVPTGDYKGLANAIIRILTSQFN